MKFWTIKSPEYRSDYRHSYVNGELDYPFGLPGVHCGICGQTWGGSRVLSHECPESLRSHRRLMNGWPVPRVEHSAIQQQVFAALGENAEVLAEDQRDTGNHDCDDRDDLGRGSGDERFQRL